MPGNTGWGRRCKEAPHRFGLGWVWVGWGAGGGWGGGSGWGPGGGGGCCGAGTTRTARNDSGRSKIQTPHFHTSFVLRCPNSQASAVTQPPPLEPKLRRFGCTPNPHRHPAPNPPLPPKPPPGFCQGFQITAQILAMAFARVLDHSPDSCHSFCRQLAARAYLLSRHFAGHFGQRRRRIRQQFTRHASYSLYQTSAARIGASAAGISLHAVLEERRAVIAEPSRRAPPAFRALSSSKKSGLKRIHRNLGHLPFTCRQHIWTPSL